MKIDFSAVSERIGKGLQKVFGSANARALSVYDKLLKAAEEHEQQFKDLDQDGLRARVDHWRGHVQGGGSLDDAMAEMFAMTRLAAMRTLGMRHFDVQLIGGAVLHQGKIAEMATGEGKTLVATLPAALNGLAGRPVYVVTVNDYLAKRDRDWMAPVFEYLGLSVGAIQSSMSPRERQDVYGCEIVYGTNNEFGFDYLRDNMKLDPEQQVQKDMYFAIVDEVDSILIDEARTPLIISGPPQGDAGKYVQADRVARQLTEDEHFEVKLKEQQCLLTEEGVAKAESLVGVESFYSDPELMEWPHLLETALRALHIYELDKNYVVGQSQRDGQPEVVIVDEFTGRLMPGRRWSDGLHQAVEAKEGIRPRQENETLATITLQNYFRMFDKLAGMTGTAMTEASEFSRIYDLDVVAIPTNRPLIRKDDNDQIYLDGDSKYEAVNEEIAHWHAKGRPILVGTTSIAKSEAISNRLQKLGVPHQVLNAKQHAREAEIVLQAGRKGAVTVATNMAGRGTDIVLGGNAEALADGEIKAKQLDPESGEAKQLRADIEAQCAREREEIRELGGLYVISTERHEARRIDNQLRGRCARQGDPGTTKFFLSFDDDLMRIFARDWVRTFMEKMGLKPGEVIESPMVTRSIARAQKKVEARNFDIRKHLLEYDEVMDKQRKFIYGQRQEVLVKDGLRGKLLGMYEHVLDHQVELYSSDKDKPVEWDELRTFVQRKISDDVDLEGLEQVEREQIFDWLMGRIEAAVDAHKEQLGEEDFDRLIQYLLIETIDTKWKDHLHAIEILKAGVGLRGYAQVDPKNEFKKEGFEKFEMLKTAIADNVTDLFFKLELRPPELSERQTANQMPQMPAQPPDPATAKAMFEALIAAGQVPPEIMERIKAGAPVRLTPQGFQVGEVPEKPADGGEPNGAADEATGEAPASGSDGGHGAIRAGSGAAQPGQPAPAVQPQQPPAQQQQRQAKPPEAQQTVPQVGRNEPCPCGSGKKYKKCHGQ